MEKEIIKICRNHQDKEKTPLIFTFAFPGAEYWCPSCGSNEGMLGAGEDVEITNKLKNRLKKYKKESRPFLSAIAMTSGAERKGKDGKYRGFLECPKQTQSYWKNKAKSWKYKN